MVSIAEIATIRETGALQNGHGTARDARQVWDRLHQRRESNPAEFTPKRHSGTAGFTYDSDGLHSFARNVLGSATSAKYMRKIVTYLTEQGALRNIGRPGRGAIWWVAEDWAPEVAASVTAIEPAAETDEPTPAEAEAAGLDDVPVPSWLRISPELPAEPDSADVRIEGSSGVMAPDRHPDVAPWGRPVVDAAAPEPAAEAAAPEDPGAALATLDAYVRGAAARHADLQARITALEAERDTALARIRELEEWYTKGLDLLTAAGLTVNG